MLSRTRLCEPRPQWLAHKESFTLHRSGGDHHPQWPAATHAFRVDFPPHCQPLNIALLADERITDNQNANALLQSQIAWHNQPPVCRTTGWTPNAAGDLALPEKRNHQRPIPRVTWLELHLARYHQRKLNADDTLDFLGKNWPITPVGRKTVTVVHQPELCFWVIPQTSDPLYLIWPDVPADHPL